MNKFMIQLTLNKGCDERMKIVTPGMKKKSARDLELLDDGEGGSFTPSSSRDLAFHHHHNEADGVDGVEGNRPRTASKLSRSMTADVSKFIEASPARNKSKKLTIDDEQDEYIAQTRREIVGLRTLVRQIQLEQDKDAAGFLDFDHRLQGMRVDLMKCKRELSNAPTWKKLEGEITKRNDEFTNLVKRSQSEILDRLQEEHGSNLEKLASWFEEHDDMAKSRQETLDKKMKSCAKANELAELKENLETDAMILKGKVTNATKSLQQAMHDLRSMKEKSAFFKLNSHFTRFMNKLVGGAFNKWKDMNDEANEQRDLEEYRSE